MSSDEEDYMSDKFLTETKTKHDGLIKNRKIQRENEVQAKKAKTDEKFRVKNRPTKVIEQEKRNEGLQTAISSNNKGFAMLAKMGYKEGQSIGKSSAGIIEPIGITIKADRHGLGRESALKELKEKKLAIYNQRKESLQTDVNVTTEQFRKRFSQKFDMKLVESDLRNCQKACQRLDSKDGIKVPALPWFWPVIEKDKESDEDDEKSEEEEESEIEYEPTEKLDMLNKFLRTSFSYCHWCGVHYFDVTDMMENCPGPDKDNH